ncbi:RNA polymerase 2 [Mycena leptocephala]|nr:RNA polymerase 2 [Mycena leptocephala]
MAVVAQLAKWCHTPEKFCFADEVKRANIAYIQWKLMKALQDVMVCYDGTARNSRGDIIQFIYGEDGMDGAFIESGSGGGVLQSCQNAGRNRKLLRTFIFKRDILSPFLYFPVNLLRVVQDATQIFRIDCRQPSDLDPIYTTDAVKALGERLIIVRGDDSLSKQAQEDAVFVFLMHLRATLAARQVVEEYRLNREAFDWVLGEVESRFNQAVVNPGKMCGILAAQSIGETATQMKPFDMSYLPGVSTKNVLRGVPRLQEILNVAANIGTPSLTVYLNPDVSNDPWRSQLVARELEDTPLRAVTSAVEIWYDPDPTSTVIATLLRISSPFQTKKLKTNSTSNLRGCSGWNSIERRWVAN